MQETRVRSLGREDPLEKGTAIHSSNLAWRIPWTEKPSGLQSKGLQTARLSNLTFTFFLSFIGVIMNCSCIEKGLFLGDAY